MSGSYSQKRISCPTPIGRFMSRVDKTPTCWLWSGARSGAGYGYFSDHGYELIGAHRWIWEFTNGPIPPELVIDHLCRVTRCVNPDHLEPVTQRENQLRGVNPSVISHLTGLCKRGHPLEPHPSPSMGGRGWCRTCAKMRRRAFYLKERALLALARNAA